MPGLLSCKRRLQRFVNRKVQVPCSGSEFEIVLCAGFPGGEVQRPYGNATPNSALSQAP
jgi:hypothetical protein